MEFILIDESKIKVMLTAEDMAHYAIKCDEMDGEQFATRRAFRQILHEVKERTGFNTSGERLLIHLYPAKDGGCEMFVFKTGDVCDAAGNTVKPTAEPRRNSKWRQSKVSIFRFGELGHLLLACRRLREADYPGDSAAYADIQSKNIYLIITEEDQSSAPYTRRLSPYLFLNEYALATCPAMMYTYIKEYCQCICEEDAVGTLACLS